MIRHEQIPVTLAAGAATATSLRPILGEILEIRAASPALGTATYAVTRKGDGGTILSASGLIAPWTSYPRGQVSAGGSAVAAIPCDDHILVAVSSGPTTATGTIHVYYRTDNDG